MWPSDGALDSVNEGSTMPAMAPAANNPIGGYIRTELSKRNFSLFATPSTAISPQLSSLYSIRGAATQIPAMKKIFSLPHYRTVDEMETQQYFYGL